jgi:hypothetical protein
MIAKTARMGTSHSRDANNMVVDHGPKIYKEAKP